MKKIILFLFCVLVISLSAYQAEVKFIDSWDKQGFSIEEQNNKELRLNYSITEFYFEDILIDNENLTNIQLPGVFLPNDEGMPNLPGSGRYIAIPQGAKAELRVIDYRIEKYSDLEIAPAPRIPLDTEDDPLEYNKNNDIYTKNTNYPENFIQLSAPSKLRGVDVVMLGITPFQYNPVSKELIVYRDIKIEVSFSGGNGHFGEDRLRNRWWDSIIKDAIFNQSVLPEIDYNSRELTRDGAEYLIICPDDTDFTTWANTIKDFRQQQGISTMIKTISEIGGNTVSAIETYVDNAYNTWSTPPSAVLLLADYSASGSGTGITSQFFTHPAGYSDFVSDNQFADVDGDDLPDIVFARITANNAAQLEVMITKFIDYETNPPTDVDFYNHPITALGWQTERWFQICSEVVGGYLREIHGKDPVRINAIYSGTPSTTWSTATNTTTVVNYFGDSGLGYIPDDPSVLGGWSGGTATDVVNAINAGSFMLQHRDHGNYTGWGEPSFQSTNISSLTNVDNKLPFIFSINCQTGAFHNASECFTEKFHRYTYNGQNSGALGVIGATEVSYSFVNDAYMWGVMDNLFPDFMPAESTTFPVNYVMPAFGNAAGKHFLYQSGWPYNTSDKQITYRLFHHHGDAFLNVCTEVPQNLTVSHSATLLANNTSFSVTANAGSFIALTVNNEIIGTADGTGSPVAISIPAQNGDYDMLVTITKQNYFRYSSIVDVIPLIPDITVNPTSYSENLVLGATQERTLSITNDGESGSILNYDILISETSGRELTKLNNYPDYTCTDQLESVTAKYKTYPSNTDATTLFHHDGYSGAVGTNSAASWISAARFTSTELSSYYTTYEITQVRIVINSADFSNCTIKVWEGGSSGNPGSEIYSQEITGLVSVGSWTAHTLSSPITLISGNEYWVGYSIIATDDHPSGTDTGPIVPEKGGWMYYGGSWQELDDLGLDRNWCIEMVIDESLAELTLTSPNGSEVWANGESHNITWNHSGAALANVKLELSTNNGTGYSDIIASTLNDGIYEWIVSGSASEECLVRVSDPTVPTTNDVSNALFTIYDTVSWLTIDQDNGSLGQGSTDNLTLTFDTSGLTAGTYNANIEISSNDPDEALFTVPVSLIVSSDPPNSPTNVTISISGSDLTISWDAVAGAISYKVYSSYDPYTGFTEDTSGSFTGESWTTSIINEKKFYHVTAEN